MQINPFQNSEVAVTGECSGSRGMCAELFTIGLGKASEIRFPDAGPGALNLHCIIELRQIRLDSFTDFSALEDLSFSLVHFPLSLEITYR